MTYGKNKKPAIVSLVKDEIPAMYFAPYFAPVHDAVDGITERQVEELATNVMQFKYEGFGAYRIIAGDPVGNGLKLGLDLGNEVEP